MASPSTPPPSERAATRALAADILEAVMADEAMPLDVHYWTKDLPDRVANVLETRIFQLAKETVTLKDERDDARSIARVLAHSYEHDSRPPATAVRDALAFPIIREEP